MKIESYTWAQINSTMMEMGHSRTSILKLFVHLRETSGQAITANQIFSWAEIKNAYPFRYNDLTTARFKHNLREKKL